MILITPLLSIAEDELSFTTSRSGGPGGQNVNKVNSRITLLFDVAASPSLSPDQKRRISARLASRINREGVLRVIAQRHRSQAANRDEAVERLAELLAAALHRPKRRIRTAIPRSARRRRLADKRHHSRVKGNRARPGSDD